MSYLHIDVRGVMSGTASQVLRTKALNEPVEGAWDSMGLWGVRSSIFLEHLCAITDLAINLARSRTSPISKGDIVSCPLHNSSHQPENRRPDPRGNHITVQAYGPSGRMLFTLHMYHDGSSNFRLQGCGRGPIKQDKTNDANDN